MHCKKKKEKKGTLGKNDVIEQLLMFSRQKHKKWRSYGGRAESVPPPPRF